jgi:hypothetical protein
MIALTSKIDVNTKPVEKDMERVSYRSLSHAAASIRKDALASVIFSRRVKSWYTVKRRRGRKIKIVRVPVWVPSDPGKPVLTHKRESLFRGAYRYDADKTSAVVGPTASKLGQGMKVHERGGMIDYARQKNGFRGRDFLRHGRIDWRHENHQFARHHHHV